MHDLDFWVSTAHECLALVRLGPCLDLESFIVKLDWAAGIRLDEEAQGVEGHFQFWCGAYED